LSAGETVAIGLALRSDHRWVDPEAKTPEPLQVLGILIAVVLEGVLQLLVREAPHPTIREANDRRIRVGERCPIAAPLVALGDI